MGIMMISSIGEYARSMKMSMKWKTKEETGNYTQKTDKVYSELDRFREQLEQTREANDPEKTAIYRKLENGKKLSAEEIEYLKENDPVSYQKYKELQSEKARYEKELKKCRTKEDVDRLQTTHLSTRFASANAIANDPHIPKIKKMELLMHENAKIKVIAEATIKFKNSLQYKNLPTDAQKRQEEKERLEELKGNQGVEKEDQVEENEPPVSEEKPETETDSENPLPETDKEDLFDPFQAAKEAATSAQKADMRKAADRDLSIHTSSYGRQVYQRETTYQPDQEAVFLKRKKA